MTIAIREAIELARADLQLVTDSNILEQLETIERMLPLSPDETLDSCIAFMCDCDGDLRRIGNDLLHVIRAWYHNNKLAWRADRKNWNRGDVEAVCVGRWESRGGKHWAELWRGRFDYYYHSNNSCGSVCNPNLSLDQAVMVMQAKVDRKKFLPCSAVVPMKRVK